MNQPSTSGAWSDVQFARTFPLVHPLLRELIRLLPPAETYWPVPARLRWLRAMAAAMDLVYYDRDEGATVIEVSLPTPPRPVPAAPPPFLLSLDVPGWAYAKGTP